MSNASFFNSSTVQGIAVYVSRSTTIPVSDILAQMADETGFGTSYQWIACKNPAGLSLNGQLGCFTSYQQAEQTYAGYYHNGYYNNVLAVAKSGASPQQVAVAIGESPWASSHYDADNTGQPGIDLINIINNYNLTQYDRLTTQQTSALHCDTTLYGTYVGTGASADVSNGLEVYTRTVGGVKINTVINPLTCSIVDVYTMAPPLSQLLRDQGFWLALTIGGIGGAGILMFLRKRSKKSAL